MIEIKDVKKRYPKASKNALDGITLTIKTGEFFTLLGPNGSGKTTLIAILSGLLSADRGEVKINGFDIRTQLAKIKPLIGIVPQEIALYPSLTLVENLKYFAKLYALSNAKIDDRIAECIAIAQLQDNANKPIHTYSGGMKRRANIAVSLVHQPKLLLLDEPTANVDPQSKHLIFQTLTQLNQEGTTMVYTTHYLKEAEALSTYVAILDRGQIIAAQTCAELMSRYQNCRDLEEVFMLLTGEHLRD